MKNNIQTEAAIAQVDANANQEWKDAALEVIHRVCVARKTFFADDVWERFIAEHGDFATTGTHDIRALGPAMRRAAALRWCECTTDYRRVSGCHNHLRPVWRSLISQEGEDVPRPKEQRNGRS